MLLLFIIIVLTDILNLFIRQRTTKQINCTAYCKIHSAVRNFSELLDLFHCSNSACVCCVINLRQIEEVIISGLYRNLGRRLRKMFIVHYLI